MPGFRNLALVVTASACAFAATRLSAYSAGPPPAHTAGFGEPSCRECHFDYELNEPDVIIRLDSLPPAYQGGRTYALQLTVRHAELKRGGFQLSARSEAGLQAGAFVITDTSLVQVRGTRSVDYLMQTTTGADLVDGDSIVWRFRWTAPAGDQRVLFHVAVNVANRDASEFGDRIFTRTFQLAPLAQ